MLFNRKRDSCIRFPHAPCLIVFVFVCLFVVVCLFVCCFFFFWGGGGGGERNRGAP